MCGIAGFIGRGPTAPATIAAMMAHLAQRGPDAQQVIGWDGDGRRNDHAPWHALLHTRLSIIDPRPVADQPMANDRGDIWIAYNGEVYGWEADARALTAAGATFRTHSDTEFILRAYEAWGIDMLPRLRGMFAIAILDLRQQQLWLIRDRMGLKPLVYAHTPQGLVFGSTVRSVASWLRPEQRRIDPEAVDAYLAHRYIPAPRTIFSGVQRLPHAQCLRYDLRSAELTQRSYWTPSPLAQSWQETLDQAVELRTVAERPVGLFLSGGVDSSTIASRLAQLGYNNITAFTAQFPGSHFDESAAAAEIARQLGLPFQAVTIPDRIAGDFAQIVADLDEPFADPSAFPMWYLARETTRHVKVVLTGDGGDELFGGYKRYRQHLRTLWRRHLRLPSPAAAGFGRSAKWRDEIRLAWVEAYVLRFSGFAPAQRRALQPQWSGCRDQWWQWPAHLPHEPLQAMLALDFENYLPEYILRKGDLTTMAHGLELRAPLLDQEVVQSVNALADHLRFEPDKGLLRRFRSRRLPGWEESAKHGFNPPLERWLAEDLAERLIGMPERLTDLTAGQISAAVVSQFVADRHFPGRAEKLLQLLVLDESLQQLRHLA